jgi:glycosyltransferase involved in cell wall biosynthesis
MPNGVDFEKGKASKQAIEELSNEYLLRSDVPVYLFVGRMMWYKGLKIILDALKILQDQGKQFVMIFVGSGMDKEEVEQYAIDLQLMRHCRFVGPVRDRNRLKAFYSRADLFLFPSTFDTNGIVVGEAAASGLASVLIRGSCAAEEVTDNRNAFLIEENADSLAQFLLRHGDQLDYLHQIGTNAMNEIYVSWEDSIANAVARYPEVIKKFEYQAPNLLNGTMMDNIIKTSGDMATALDLVHRVNSTISTSINEMLDRWL